MWELHQVQPVNKDFKAKSLFKYTKHERLAKALQARWSGVHNNTHALLSYNKPLYII